MPTRTGVLIPIIVAAVIIGIAGMLTIPTDIKLEYVEFPRGTIKVDDKVLEVQIADTKELRTRGLSWNPEKLPYDEGMLFVFDGSGTRIMWMLGMQFNLDIICFKILLVLLLLYFILILKYPLEFFITKLLESLESKKN